ncbi:MAG: RNA polymerase subunit sigma-70 [Nannocystaceae bacterium]|nr:RNA polymerase subunit sigma-70 [Nannocystaceae bacterium]
MDLLEAARGGDEAAFAALVAPHRRELRGFCYRMAGSLDDADDLVQESLLRAWRGLPGFAGRASLRTWLYRVAASACIDALKHRSARRRAQDLGPAADPDAPIPAPQPGEWIEPCTAALYDDDAGSPERRLDAREGVALALLAALQLLPPQQRAALVACDVLGLSAAECAELLDTTTTAVNSALRRARDTIAARAPAWQPARPGAPGTAATIARWIDAWDRRDPAALVELLHDDASMTMPPLPIWLHGPQAIAASIDAMVFRDVGPSWFRAQPLEANGVPALAIWRRMADGSEQPYALQLLELDGERVRGLTAYLDPRVFETLGLLAPR